MMERIAITARAKQGDDTVLAAGIAALHARIMRVSLPYCA